MEVTARFSARRRSDMTWDDITKTQCDGRSWK
jgi:hypothetical protein